MNWYKTSLIKKAKHVSDHSNYCFYCKSFLIPRDFTRNERHHFPWGIRYLCDCQKSGLWTNSIRGEKELIDIVFNNKQLNEFPYLEGFCNDLFCPFCFKHIQILKNGLMMDATETPIIYVPEVKKYYYLSNYDAYIRKYNKDVFNPKTQLDPEYIGNIASTQNIVKDIDVEGCESLKHNIGIIPLGPNAEYGEGQYKEIYDWIKNNKNKIPQEMLSEFSK